MKKLFFIVLLIFQPLIAIEKINEISVGFNVMSINLKNNLLYISTDGGEVDIYDINAHKFKHPITVPTVKTYFNDSEKSKVFSTDELNGKILILSESDYGGRRLTLLSDNEVKNFDLKNQSVKKAFFIDENTAVFASLSNEIYYYDLKEAKVVFSYKFSTSALNDMEITDDRKHVALGCESGLVYLFDIKDKKIIKQIVLHKDNIYDVAISKNDIILSGSADKNAGIYIKDRVKNIPASFLVYAVGISDDGRYGAFMVNEDSDILVFDTYSLEQKALITTGQSTINGIVFLDDYTLITSAYERKIYFWRFL